MLVKRISVFLSVMMFAAAGVPLASAGIYVQGKVGYFVPSEREFKDLYSQRLMYGGEIGLDIVGGFGAWLGLDYYKGTGKLTVTQESTELTLMPIGLGLRFAFIRAGSFHPYVAAGAAYFSYKESNVIGTVKKSNLGMVGKAGLVIAVFKPVCLDAQVSYSYCKVKPAEIEADLGGLQAGVALRVAF